MNLRLFVFVWVGLSFTGCKGCEEVSETEPEVLAEISTGIQFASVKVLGPHHMQAVIQYRDERSGEITEENDETRELIWQDEDSFSSRVLRDGRVQSQVVVVDGVPYKGKNDGSWQKREDAEPMRVGVYTTWNVWDDALDLFSDRIEYSDPVADVYEGRDVRRFTVSLAESKALSKKAARRQRKDGEPTHLSGEVWIDGETAVRLKAEVTGVWQKGELKRIRQLTLDRTNIGAAQGIEVPDGPIEARGSSFQRRARPRDTTTIEGPARVAPLADEIQER